MEQVKWFDRSFDFDKTQNIFPEILERLSGTPARLEEKIKSVNPAFLARKEGNAWSIKENIGHLSDLEPLWQQRLSDIIGGRPELSPTDLLNKKTDEAHHNEVPLEKLLHRFRELRRETMVRLEGIDEATVFRSALHPRLKTPMRTMDLFLFVAEHDDHHLAIITALSKGKG